MRPEPTRETSRLSPGDARRRRPGARFPKTLRQTQKNCVHLLRDMPRLIPRLRNAPGLMRCAHSFRGARKTTGKIGELPGIFGNARLRPAKRRSLRRASAASPPSSAVFPPSSARLICRSRSPLSRPLSPLPPLPGPLFPADDSACRAPFSCRQREGGQSRPPDSVLRPAKNRCRKTLPAIPPDTKNPRAE